MSAYNKYLKRKRKEREREIRTWRADNPVPVSSSRENLIFLPTASNPTSLFYYSLIN